MERHYSSALLSQEGTTFTELQDSSSSSLLGTVAIGTLAGFVIILIFVGVALSLFIFKIRRIKSSRIQVEPMMDDDNDDNNDNNDLDNVIFIFLKNVSLYLRGVGLV